MANRRIAKKRKIEQTAAPAVLEETAVCKGEEKKTVTALCIQYQGWEVTAEQVEAAVTEQWMREGKDAQEIGKLDIYLKPEEKRAYYVVNGLVHGSVQL